MESWAEFPRRKSRVHSQSQALYGVKHAVPRFFLLQGASVKQAPGSGALAF